MAWKSKSFTHRETSTKVAVKVASAAAKHKTAMRKIVDEAKAFTREREEAIKMINDPQLRKSVTR